MKWLLALLPLTLADMTPRVAVEAAYSLTAGTDKPSPAPGGCVSGCKCDNGLLIHGDNHKTRCKCPKTCPCQKGFPD